MKQEYLLQTKSHVHPFRFHRNKLWLYTRLGYRRGRAGNITTVLVYDIAGKQIENIQWQKMEVGKASIDISHLANGFYTCIAKTNTNKTYYGKLAKQ